MYHDKSMTGGTDALVQQIKRASASQRLKLQPELTRLVDMMQRSNTPIPPQVRILNEQLLEEAIEARFDNLPV